MLDPQHQPVSDSSFALPADGYIHVQPLGEYEFFDRAADGSWVSRGIMVIDAAAVSSQIQTFNRERDRAGSAFAGLLLDYDHCSLDQSRSSEAAGWIVDMQSRADGLWVKPRWTDSGLAAVMGGRFRFASNVHLPAQTETIDARRFRPVRVDRFALTNDPRFLQGRYRMQPISSRADESALSTVDRQVAPTTPPASRQGGHMDYRSTLIDLLGLQPEATDEQIQTALADAKTAMASSAQVAAERDACKSRAAIAEGILAQRKADDTIAALEKDGHVFASRDSVRAALVADHDRTASLLRSITPGKPAEPLRSRADAKQPDIALADSYQSRRDARESFIATVAKEYNITSRAESWAKAAQLKPELFRP
jgi:phage I-like protein